MDTTHSILCTFIMSISVNTTFFFIKILFSKLKTNVFNIDLWFLYFFFTYNQSPTKLYTPNCRRSRFGISGVTIKLSNDRPYLSAYRTGNILFVLAYADHVFNLKKT